MSDDLIRRSDAIKSLNDYLGDCYRVSRRKYEKTMLDAISMDFEAVITNVPAVEPKQGEWIFRTIFPNDKSEFPMGYLECSICGSTHANKTPCNFCDNCGARMKGTDDE